MPADITFYGYDKCGTCRKAEAFLRNEKIPYTKIDITTTPPSADLLQDILKAGIYTITDLFNKSGELYRILDMKNKIRILPEKELIKMLSQTGRLVKRPIVTDGIKATVGFNEAVFSSTWKK